METKVKRIYPGKQIKDIKFYKVEDLEAILGLKKRTIRKYLRTGRIPGAIKLGRRYFVSTKNFDRYIGKK
ncbi:DNA-binding protein [Candidatus Atribacteria bacterium 1244-E10-H5-B2]|nr:MAG: DNA-binding protein [Candidatus Atribacteria bacterium 1244-E10-H5-B2]